jgi:DNA / pantothenate metabolism flavoprotein
MYTKKIHVVGGGTVSHIKNHFAVCAPAYGATARKIFNLFKESETKLEPVLHLTKMAGGESLETNQDISDLIDKLVEDVATKIVVLNAALCDFEGAGDKYSGRFSTKEGDISLNLTPAPKVINKIRKKRKDIFAVGFKTTCGADIQAQYLAGLDLLKSASLNLVLANDTKTRMNMIITPEEAKYCVTNDRDLVLKELVNMSLLRSHLTFTKSTVVDGSPIAWNSNLVPSSLRTVVNHCIQRSAYKPFKGATVGHFAAKIGEGTFLTSIRKSNFNDLEKNGLVKVTTDGPDSVIAYGAKPSVGGQSQRIIFSDHKEYNCIVHFHCPKKEGSPVPTVSQKEYECGSHECGKNTSNGLKKFGNLSAVYLDEHGPNIVFNENIEPQEVISFIENNFDLNGKTGGPVQ